jgi:hypothetical protein
MPGEAQRLGPGATQSAIGGRVLCRMLRLRIRRDRVPRLVQQCTNQRARPDRPKHLAGRADPYPLRPTATPPMISATTTTSGPMPA